jgi:hypothetical protein
MAIPPEPLDLVLPRATWVVEAEVAEVLSQGPEPKNPALAPSAPMKLRSQVVRLKVRRVLRGPQKAGELTAEKPEGSYVLTAGNHGPFLLDASRPNPVILGRYGPDSYPLKKLEAALAAS